MAVPFLCATLAAVMFASAVSAQPAPPVPPRQVPPPRPAPTIAPKPGPAAQRPPAQRPPARLPTRAPAPVVVPAPLPAPEPGRPAAPTKGSHSGLPLPRFAALRSDEVYLRTGPGPRYPIDWVYKRRDLPLEIEREFDGSGYGAFKHAVAEAVVQYLTPVRERYQEFRADEPALEGILATGAEKARAIASDTLRDVRRAMGVGPVRPGG